MGNQTLIILFFPHQKVGCQLLYQLSHHGMTHMPTKWKLYFLPNLKLWSQYSSVNIVTRLWAAQPKSGSSMKLTNHYNLVLKVKMCGAKVLTKICTEYFLNLNQKSYNLRTCLVYTMLTVPCIYVTRSKHGSMMQCHQELASF